MSNLWPEEAKQADPEAEIARAAQFLHEKLEPDVFAVHMQASIASAAVSLKRIADTLPKLVEVLHTGNVGQGSNLSYMEGIKRALENINSNFAGVAGANRQTKIEALQRTIADIIAKA